MFDIIDRTLFLTMQSLEESSIEVLSPDYLIDVPSSSATPSLFHWSI